jgi:hypothetical protein
VAGLEHAAHAAVSSEHSNVAAESLDVKVNVACVSDVGSSGPEPIDVCGASAAEAAAIAKGDRLCVIPHTEVAWSAVVTSVQPPPS